MTKLVQIDSQEHDTNGLPVYVVIDSGVVAETKELIEGRVTADYDVDGDLLGIEVIG